MGRKRTSGCQLSHEPGERCNLCERLRARKTRAKARSAKLHATKKRATSTTPAAPETRSTERIAIDKAAQKRQKALRRARAYVQKYLNRKAITPPATCERCDQGEYRRTPPGLRPRHDTISFWHPNPQHKHDIAWLCRSCSNYARHSDEDIELSWSWPGHPIPLHRGRPPRVSLSEPALKTHLLEAERTAAPLRKRLGPVGDALLSATLKRLFGNTLANELLRQGFRALQQGRKWTPLERPELDAILCRWVDYERSYAPNTKPRWVAPPTPIERRPRIDRKPHPAAFPPTNQLQPAASPPFDHHAQAQEREAALAKFEDVCRTVEAIWAKYGM